MNRPIGLNDMKTQNLFRSKAGDWLTRGALLAALAKVKAADCQVLYLHSGLSFGVPNSELRRSDLLAAIYDTIRELGVPTLCVPTFTFSFCNSEDYNVAESKSHMGALNEFIRRRPEATRSLDPLMSVAMVGTDRDLVENLGHESIGADSTFDKLSRRRGVKFLFLGVLPGDCFTYMHYLEWKDKVPYRYNREFSGRITAYGRTYEDTYTLFVRYRGVTPNAASHAYAKMLQERGHLRVLPFGDSHIGCVAEPEASAAYLELLRAQPDFFIERPFSPGDVDKTFVAHDMVAL